MPPQWLDLAKDGCASIASAATARARLSSLGFAHSRGAKKVSPLPPPLRFGLNMGAAAIALGLQIAIEAAMVAGSYSQGELSWQISGTFKKFRRRFPGRDRHA